jgi:bifunctional DNA-binding transcriptional regulator/antitoxin component of YhaV-PrlF toxin-antitoxin module
MTVATISAKGWIVIPAELRKKHDLQPGSDDPRVHCQREQRE